MSVDLSEQDLATVDDFQRAAGLSSRSAVIRHAIRQLPRPEVEGAYEQAWEEWDNSDDAALWENVVADGLPGRSRGSTSSPRR